MAVSGYLDPSKIKTTERGIIVNGVLYSSLEITKNGIKTVKSLSLKSYKGDELSRMKDIQLLFADILSNSPRIDPKKLSDYEWVVYSNEDNPSTPTIESIELNDLFRESLEGEDLNDAGSQERVLFQKNGEEARQINPPFRNKSFFPKYPSNQKNFQSAFLQLHHLLNPNNSLPASSRSRVGVSSLPPVGSTNRTPFGRAAPGRSASGSPLSFQEELLRRANERNGSRASNRNLVSGSAFVGPSSHTETSPPASGTPEAQHSAESTLRGRVLSPTDPLPPPILPQATNTEPPRRELPHAETPLSSIPPAPRLEAGSSGSLLSEVSDDGIPQAPQVVSAISPTNLNTRIAIPTTARENSNNTLSTASSVSSLRPLVCGFGSALAFGSVAALAGTGLATILGAATAAGLAGSYISSKLRTKKALERNKTPSPLASIRGSRRLRKNKHSLLDKAFISRDLDYLARADNF
jgi:hypothetical protein